MKSKDLRKMQHCGCFQQDMADCGVACLVTVFRYCGTNISLEYARELSGTNAQGTTLLGMVLCAQKIGFEANGYEMDFATLCQQENPTIVHVLLANGFQHFIVFCGVKHNNVIAFDPARGMVHISKDEFQKIWTKRTLIVKPKNIKIETAKTGKKMFSFLSHIIANQKILFVGLIVLSVIIALLGMATSLLFQKLIDDYLPNNAMSIVLLSISAVSLLTIIKVGLSAIKQLIVAKQYKEIQESMVERFFEKILSLKLSFFESRKIGDLSARLGDIRRIQGVVNYVIGGNTFIDVFVVIIGTCIVGYYAWQMPIIVLTMLVITLAFMMRYNRVIIDKQRNMMAAYSKVESSFINTIKNVRSIKVERQTNAICNVNNILYKQYTDNSYKADKLQIKLSLYYGFVNAILLFTSLLICALLYNDQRISVGEFIAIGSIVSLMTPSIINISYNEAKMAFERLFGTIDLPSEVLVGDDCPIIASIEIKNLSFGYIGREPIINDFSATLCRGKINCIVGKSGSGKSTVCKLIEKSYVADDEAISINGSVPINRLAIEAYRKHIGIVPQNIQLFEGHVIENICVGFDGDITEAYQRAIAICTEKGLMPYLSALPNSIYTIVGEAGVDLSGGEKQLVAIARLLIQNPDVLILDEPTSAMDTELRDKVWSILSDMCETHLVIVVTHQASLLNDFSQHISFTRMQ